MTGHGEWTYHLLNASTGPLSLTRRLARRLL